MSRFHPALFGLAIACVLSAAAAQAALVDIAVPNGDFSSPDTDTYSYTVPTSWTATSASQVGISTFGSLNGGNDQFLFHDFTPAQTTYLYQTDIGANFVQGATYTLDFYYANGNVNPYTMTANICYNAGNSAMAMQDFAVTASEGWTHGSISGIAAGEATGPIGIVFRFAVPAVDGNYQGWLDHVTLTQSAVPEPSACVLLATGLFGLLAYAWRRRT